VSPDNLNGSCDLRVVMYSLADWRTELIANFRLHPILRRFPDSRPRSLWSETDYLSRRYLHPYGSSSRHFQDSHFSDRDQSGAAPRHDRQLHEFVLISLSYRS
jgi:hypothetical protein